MKIIKEGVPEEKYEPDVYIGKCEHCECEFEFESKEKMFFCRMPAVFCPWCGDICYVNGAQKKEKENV